MLRDEVALVVPGAPAQTKPSLTAPLNGLGRPVFLGARRDGHHVLVRHQRDALGLGVRIPARCRAGCSPPTTSRLSDGVRARGSGFCLQQVCVQVPRTGLALMLAGVRVRGDGAQARTASARRLGRPPASSTGSTGRPRRPEPPAAWSAWSPYVFARTTATSASSASSSRPRPRAI